MSSSSLPMLFHAHHQEYKQDLPFWQSLAFASGGPILELGCGTGRVLTFLASKGLTVYGIDLNMAMLIYLRKLLPNAYINNVRLIHGKMSEFHLDLEFNLIILPCNTFTTLSALERERTLKCVNKHLQSGGVFALSIPNHTLFSEIMEEPFPEIDMIVSHPENGNPIQISSEIENTLSNTKITWHYDGLFEDGTVERISSSSDHVHISKKNLETEMTRHGFSHCSFYGDFDFSTHTSNSPYLIAVAS